MSWNLAAWNMSTRKRSSSWSNQSTEWKDCEEKSRRIKFVTRCAYLETTTARKDSKKSKRNSKSLDSTTRLSQMPMTTNLKSHNTKAMSHTILVQTDQSTPQVSLPIFQKTQRWHLSQENIYWCLRKRTEPIWKKRNRDLSSRKGPPRLKKTFCALCSLKT